jgi:hypothetical protein
MYDQIQTALTITIEVIALIGFIGLPIHAMLPTTSTLFAHGGHLNQCQPLNPL